MKKQKLQLKFSSVFCECFGLLLVVGFCWIISPSHISENNKDLTMKFYNNIPHIAIIGTNKYLQDIIIISDGRKFGKVSGTCNSLYFQGSEQQIAEYYKNELTKVGNWNYAGCYTSSSNVKPDYAENSYYWEKDGHVLLISFNQKESEAYNQTGTFKNERGLKYHIWMLTSTVKHETLNEIKKQ